MNQKQLGSIILYCIGSTDKPVDWSTIRYEVDRAGWEPTPKQDWMFVRGALQALINAGFIVRTNDVRNEQYILS